MYCIVLYCIVLYYNVLYFITVKGLNPGESMLWFEQVGLPTWFTNLQPNPLKRFRKLPAAYERLLQSEYRTADENAD